MTIRTGFSNFFWPIMALVCTASLPILAKPDVLPADADKVKGTENSGKVVIGIARMSEISNNSIFFKEINKKILKMQKALQEKSQSLRKDIEAKVKKLQALSKSGVNEKVMQEKQKALQKEVGEKERMIQGEQAKIQNVQQAHMIEIFRQVKLIFKSLGEKHGLTIILDGESALYYSKDQTVDVTQEALTMLNAVKSEDIKESINSETASPAA